MISIGTTAAWRERAASLFPGGVNSPVRAYRREAKECDAGAFVRFFHRLRDARILLPPSQFEAWFVSAAHDDAVIEATLEAASS